ncbi:MAG: hypothetical protein LBD88_04145 [Candidatus Peribacteria bacterium]|jgi:predicted nucleic-acid-binding Zn-ribbon protein|nr:hypothetical protein [Candidatus Peribacteria bacterium]
MQCFNEQKSINENQIILSYYIKHSTDKIYDKVQPGKLLEYLQNQLRLFEIKFCKYIDLVCKNCSGASFFNDEIKNLIRFIIGNENDEDLKSGKDSLYILSFNYSYYPYLAIGVEDKSVNIVKNDKIFIVINNSFWVSIHGDCRDLNIIIGIDDHQLKNESHKL